MTDFAFGMSMTGMAMAGMGFVLASRLGQKDPVFELRAVAALGIYGCLWLTGTLALYSSMLGTVMTGDTRPTFMGFATGSIMLSFTVLLVATGLWSIVFGVLKKVAKKVGQLRERWQQIQAVR